MDVRTCQFIRNDNNWVLDMLQFQFCMKTVCLLLLIFVCTFAKKMHGLSHAANLPIFNLHSSGVLTTDGIHYSKVNSAWNTIRSTASLTPNALSVITAKIKNGTDLYFGVTTDSSSDSGLSWLGKDQKSWGYSCSNGHLYIRGNNINFNGTKCGPNDTVVLKVDLRDQTGGTVEFLINDKSQGTLLTGLNGLQQDIFYGITLGNSNDVVKIVGLKVSPGKTATTGQDSGAHDNKPSKPKSSPKDDDEEEEDE